MIFKTLLVSSMLVGSSFAMNEYDIQYTTLSKVVVTDLESGKVVSQAQINNSNEGFDFAQKVAPSVQPGLGTVLAEAKQIIAFGKEIYEIIKKGKPVVAYDSQAISVLPMGADKKSQMSPMDMENWSEPTIKKYKIEFKNYLGMTPVSFEWHIVYSYGGQLDGKGAYIAGAQIKAAAIDVSWGYDLDVSYKLQGISNTGTKENPVANAVLTLKYKVETVMKTTIRDLTYSISGKGSSNKL